MSFAPIVLPEQLQLPEIRLQSVSHRCAALHGRRGGPLALERLPRFSFAPVGRRVSWHYYQEGLSLVVERSELEAASLAGGEADCAPNPNRVIRTVSRLEVRVVGPVPIPAVSAHPLA